MSGLLMSHREKISMQRFQTVRLKTVRLKIVVSICAMKILAKETAVFVPIAVPWVCRFVVFSIELERIFFED